MKKITVFLSFVILLVLSSCSNNPSLIKDTNTTKVETSKIDTTKNEIKTVKMGAIIPMSGDVSVYGEEIQKIFEYRLQEINEKAKQKGYKFEIIYEDGKCDGGASILAFQKLTDIDNVKFILGGICSSESLAIVPYLKEKGVVAISSISSSPELKNKSSNFFSISYSDDFIGDEIANELGKYSKIAMITEQNDYNQGLRTVILNNLKNNFPNSKIVIDEEFSRGATEFRNQLNKIKNSNPDVFFLNPNVGITTASLAKQLAEIQDWNVKKVAHYAFYSPELAILTSKIFDNTVIIDTPSINSPEFNSTLESIVANKGAVSNLGNFYSATTIDILDILTNEIIENNANPISVQWALANDSFSGFSGNFTFNKNSFADGRESARFILKNGKIENL